jgi:hypothetical protein
MEISSSLSLSAIAGQLGETLSQLKSDRGQTNALRTQFRSEGGFRITQNNSQIHTRGILVNLDIMIHNPFYDWRATGSIQSVLYYLALKAEATAYRFPDRFVWVVNRNNNTVPLMNVARDSKIQECFFAQTISRVPTMATRRGALLP